MGLWVGSVPVALPLTPKREWVPRLVARRLFLARVLPGHTPGQFGDSEVEDVYGDL